VIGSSTQTATASMVLHPDKRFPVQEIADRLAARSRSIFTIDSAAATIAALGDPATANVHLLAVAVQRGAIPVSPSSIERAIELNGVAVDQNLAAFRLGRADAAAAAEQQRAEATANGELIGHRPFLDTEPLDALVERLRLDLVAYQSPRYANEYASLVASARATGSDAFGRSVAVHLHRLMAYKDEYEVARLLLLPASRAAAEAVGGPGARVSWNLHPPALRSLGLSRKIRLGRAAAPMMHALRAVRRVRGTPFDVFGYASVRRLERRLVREYRAAIEHVIDRFDAFGEEAAVAIADLPEPVRGYERLKVARGEAFLGELRDHLDRAARRTGSSLA